jgi:cytochrome c
MTFQGIKNDQERTGQLAFLKDVTGQGSAPSSRAVQQDGGMGMGMMGGREFSLKTLDPPSRVQAISYCADTYRVTTADGKTRAFWERNLRLMTDSSDRGPQQGVPALVPAGMMGDCADTSSSRLRATGAELEEELLLQRTGNFAKPARSPPSVGSGRLPLSAARRL